MPGANCDLRTAGQWGHCLAVLVLVVTAFLAAVPASAQSSEIEYLRNQAEDAREFADKQRTHAQQWRDRADEARRRAQESERQIDRDSYLDDARLYDERAENSAIDADKAEAEAAKAEAELLQVLKTLERGPAQSAAEAPPAKPATEPKPETSTPAIPLEEVIGVWTIDGRNSLFAIVQEDPGSEVHPYKLEAHTEDRVWKGAYSSFDEGDIRRTQNARVVFKYKPQANEMNEAIPDWARQEIEGQLEWEIELNEPDVCGGSPALAGQFFPGKVKWNEDTKTVRLDGRGEPRAMTLSLQLLEPTEAYVSTSIRIRPPGLGAKSDDDQTADLLPFAPLQALVENQLFHVDVSLPYELAKEQGEKLTITLRGLSGGERETVELIRGAFRRGRPARYTTYRPLFLGDSKPFLSQSWQDEIGDHAQRVDLDLENGESVAIGFDKTFEIVPVYKDIEEYTIARYLEAANFLQNLHRVRLVMPGAPKEDREDAHVRLLRLKNFQILMSNPDNPAWLRVLLAEEYLGPVEDASQVMYNPEKIYGAGQIRVSNINAQVRMKNTIEDMWPNALNEWERNGDNDEQGRFNGIIWSNAYERIRVMELVGGAWRERARQAFENFMVNITLGFYEWALSEASVGYGRFSIGVADLFALSGDVDHYGHKLPKGKKIEIIANVLLANLTNYAGDTLRDSMIDDIAGYQAPGDKLLTMKDVVQAVRGRNVEKRKVKLTPPPGSRKTPDLPDTMTEKQKESAAPALAIDSENANLAEPLSCAPPRAKPGSPESAGESVGKAITVAQRYGENAVITQQHEPDARKQEFGTCQAEAVLHAAGVDMDPIAVLRLLAENSKEFAAKLRTANREEHPLVYGFTEDEMHLLASLLGRETIPLPSGKKMSMAALKSWKDNGWSIKMAIHAEDYTGPGDNKHAVDIVGFEQNPDGCGLLVTVYDKGIEGTITMPVEDFQRRLAEWPVMLHRPQGEQQAAPALPARMTSSTEPPPRTGPAHFNPDADDGDDLRPIEITPVDRQYSDQEARRIIGELEPKEQAGTMSVPEGIKLLDARMSIRTRKQLEGDARNRPSWIPSRDMTLHDLVAQLPERDREIPMHVTSTAALFEIAADGKWDIPTGPSFSHGEGITDSLREGNVAIRVRQGHEGFVELVPDTKENKGMLPVFWPSGRHGEGKPNQSQIPTEHLEFLDPGQGPGQERWIPIPPPENVPPSKRK